MSTAQYVSLWSESPALPMLQTNPKGKNTLIFLAGLSDTLATVPYLPLLAKTVAPLDFDLVQPQLSSSLGGYGLSSLEADAQEVCLLIEHLQSCQADPKPKDGKIVLMGHSTGTNDIIRLLSQDRHGIIIDGVILQAPVSDREYFEGTYKEGSKELALLKQAITLVEEGKGSTLLERHTDAPNASTAADYRVNSAAFQNPAMTAYRYWSLNAVGGDDDYFSSDLPEGTVAEMWTGAIKRGHHILALLGEKDEYYPSNVTPQQIAAKWNRVVNQTSGLESHSFRALVLPDADHKVEEGGAQIELVRHVVALLHKTLQDKRQAQEESPSSFEQVVELITNGKADSIAGVKQIPLKINEAKPSTSQMQRPVKPWENASEIERASSVADQ
ncbi:hypothetical protein CBS101457_000419 [Exobasidium rhododendri]|nr:hypothetical protein CBS101457_000419 [Exobasidium rhododendri]